MSGALIHHSVWRKLVLSAVVALGVMVGQGQASADKPSDRKLVLSGMAMGVPTYLLGLSLHEGSHALMAKYLGADLVDFSLVPGYHPGNGAFYLGYTTVRGLKNNTQRAWFLMAPKITNSILLGGFAILHGTDSLPSNHYGQTAVLVLATGFWVDFSRDILAFSKFNDTVKIYDMLGMDTQLKRIPGRLVHLSLSALMGYSIYRGYQELFEDEPGAAPSSFLLPMYQSSF